MSTAAKQKRQQTESEGSKKRGKPVDRKESHLQLTKL
jgi:hypothetical protein